MTIQQCQPSTTISPLSCVREAGSKGSALLFSSRVEPGLAPESRGKLIAGSSEVGLSEGKVGCGVLGEVGGMAWKEGRHFLGVSRSCYLV